jgi:hypothetical protein
MADLSALFRRIVAGVDVDDNVVDIEGGGIVSDPEPLPGAKVHHAGIPSCYLLRVRLRAAVRRLMPRRGACHGAMSFVVAQQELHMVSRGRHQKKEVADALRRAAVAGLSNDELHQGHRWGVVRCNRCMATRSISSTPRNPGAHAKQIDRFAVIHTH